MLNRIVIMGRLAREPETRETNSGLTCCNFTVAVDRDFSGSGEKKTDFIDCVAWRQTAEFISKYFKKGSMVVVLGTLQINQYQKDGENRRAASVVVENVYFGESKKKDAEEHTDTAPVQKRDIAELSQFKEVHTTSAQQSFVEIEPDGDLPF